jgi:hypothetical protein
VILSGGGPDDGEPLLMTSYRSELGGLASALAVLGMLETSGTFCEMCKRQPISSTSMQKEANRKHISQDRK